MKNKNIMTVRFLLAAFIFLPAGAMAQNKLTKKQKKTGWILLFDGYTTAGWRDASVDTLPKGSWKIEDGAIMVTPKNIEKPTGRGDIVTEQLYDNFELSVDFKITARANSGIKYFVDQRALGLEYQIIDDELHPDAKMGSLGNRTMSSLYDLIPASSAKVVKPVGEWNTARIVSNGSHVEHWLNGFKVLEYERGSDNFKGLVANSKYKTIPNFGLNTKGRILLQDHGDEIYFRNIMIREIENPDKTLGKTQMNSLEPVLILTTAEFKKDDARFDTITFFGLTNNKFSMFTIPETHGRDLSFIEQ